MTCSAIYHPNPARIWEQYERCLEALSVLEEVLRQERAELLREDSCFLGLLRREAEEVLAETRGELDAQTCLMLLASFEAELLTACRTRRGWKGMRPMARELRDIFSQKPRAGVEDVLDILVEYTNYKEPIRNFKGLFKYRHWMAHGRYFPSRCGFQTVVPEAVWQMGVELFENLPGLTPPEKPDS